MGRIVTLQHKPYTNTSIRREDIPPPARWPERLDLAQAEAQAGVRVPIYAPSEIQIARKFLIHPWVLQVSTPDGQLLCCKLSGGHMDAFRREYDTLRKIYDEGCATGSFRVPQLRGLICSESGHGEGGIVGILMDFIDTEQTDFTFHLAPPVPALMSPGEKGKATIEREDNSFDGQMIQNNHFPRKLTHSVVRNGPPSPVCCPQIA